MFLIFISANHQLVVAPNILMFKTSASHPYLPDSLKQFMASEYVLDHPKGSICWKSLSGNSYTQVTIPFVIPISHPPALSILYVLRFLYLNFLKEGCSHVPLVSWLYSSSFLHPLSFSVFPILIIFVLNPQLNIIAQNNRAGVFNPGYTLELQG